MGARCIPSPPGELFRLRSRSYNGMDSFYRERCRRAASEKRASAATDCQTGFTIVELLVVIFFVALVASLATVKLSGIMADAKIRAAEADLATLREAFMGSATHPGYIADMERVPGFSPAWLRLDNLLSTNNLCVRGGVFLRDVAA